MENHMAWFAKTRYPGTHNLMVQFYELLRCSDRHKFPIWAPKQAIRITGFNHLNKGYIMNSNM